MNRREFITDHRCARLLQTSTCSTFTPFYSATALSTTGFTLVKQGHYQLQAAHLCKFRRVVSGVSNGPSTPAWICGDVNFPEHVGTFILMVIILWHVGISYFENYCVTTLYSCLACTTSSSQVVMTHLTLTLILVYQFTLKAAHTGAWRLHVNTCVGEGANK